MRILESHVCPDCPSASAAREMVFDASFLANLGYGVLPFAVTGLAIAVLVRIIRARGETLGATHDPLVVAALCLGVGLGGFVDGIVLHQILQWHNMLSNVVPTSTLVGAKYNMVWDGIFHALTWATTLLGACLLFRAHRKSAGPWSSRLFGGCMLAGWGLFDLVEGVINHHLLALHHVRPGPHQLAWDLAFLFGGGLGFIALGIWIARRRHHEILAA